MTEFAIFFDLLPKVSNIFETVFFYDFLCSVSIKKLHEIVTSLEHGFQGKLSLHFWVIVIYIWIQHRPPLLFKKIIL